MIWVFGAAILFVLYVLISPDPFASALRAQIPFLQRKGANAVDSVDARVEAAKQAQEGTVRFGRKSLYDIQVELASSKINLDRAKIAINDDNQALALAKKNNDRDAFNTLVQHLNNDTAYYNGLVENHEAIVEQLKSLEVTVDDQEQKEKMIDMQGSLMISKARVADVVEQVNKAQAGLTDNGADAHMKAAQKILDRKTSGAMAATVAAGGLTQGERDEKLAQKYVQQAKTGAGISADDLWAKMDSGSKSAS